VAAGVMREIAPKQGPSPEQRLQYLARFHHQFFEEVRRCVCNETTLAGISSEILLEGETLACVAQEQVLVLLCDRLSLSHELESVTKINCHKPSQS